MAGMLVLTREREQSVRIGSDVLVKVVAVSGERVRLGFQAPPDVPIDREEIFQAKATGAGRAQASAPPQPSGVHTKMSLLVTGSIAIDNVKTPHGEAKGVYGGSAVYFSLAAQLFTPVRFVGVVGEDFPADFRAYLEKQKIDLAGLEVRKGSKTFRWSGSYAGENADAETTAIELNVLAEAGPKIPPQFADTQYVFLAATHPALQKDLVTQLKSPRFIMADTRDLWIKTERAPLIEVFKVVHGVIMNDFEARLLTEEVNLVLAGRKILDMGPQYVVIKKGEHGSMLVSRDAVAVLPAYPTTQVVDPTGAGDSFAGGMMGYLATCGELTFTTIKQALARGTVTASFAIEDFSMRRIEKVTAADLDQRLGEYSAMLKL
ncbi:MAG TPA: PfkB family carbohydrate kinase [Phycisphaerae bacterium]|nr:PfkB family carbohydrate kinase [Phycisphaerae bacterium]HOM53422.1 PfkB family carbohydrate kinase [Phycisphaerae bacterium]HOQ85035.1 PfkB family carbohydrate kinase [Phycisphaerae bacterium]HPP28699.1 PfkB family carbohydrate kinase [Phycisphaerae bacterium]HPU28093.1 PfkB family carbohydrate kinase [Phycisphaerae bacterium]